MGNSSKPRKPYTRRMVNIPITQALVDEFGMTMHTGLATLEFAPSGEAFDAVGRCLNVIGIALKEKALLAREHMPVIESGVLAMQQIGERAARLDIWHTTEFELIPIRRAVTTAEFLLSKFQVMDLYLAIQVLGGICARDHNKKPTNMRKSDV